MSDMLMGTPEELIRRSEENEKKMMRDQKERDFTEGVKNLGVKTLEAKTKGDMVTYSILYPFLEAALNIQKMMTTISSVSEAMSCISDAMLFIDEALKVDDIVMQETVKVKYGMFYAMRQRRAMRKTKKNISGRMKAMIRGTMMKFEMATMLGKIMEDLAKEMESFTVKQNRKKEKIAAGGAGMLGGAPAPRSAADDFLDDLARDKGYEVPEAPADAGGDADIFDGDDIP